MQVASPSQQSSSSSQPFVAAHSPIARHGRHSSLALHTNPKQQPLLWWQRWVSIVQPQ